MRVKIRLCNEERGMVASKIHHATTYLWRVVRNFGITISKEVYIN